MGTTERVKKYLDFKGISKYKFYQETGFSNKFLDNSSNMGTNKAEIILRHYPDINPEWLLSGVGEMTKTDTEEPEKETTESNDKVSEPKPKYRNKSTGVIKLKSKDSDSPIIELSKINNDSYRCFKSSGYSMGEQFNNSFIIGKRIENPSFFEEGRIHIIIPHNNSSHFIKRLFRSPDSDSELILRSDNNDNNNSYPPITIEIDNIESIWIFETLITHSEPAYKQIEESDNKSSKPPYPKKKTK